MSRELRTVLLAVSLVLVFPASAMGFGQLSSFGELGGGPGQLDAPKQAVFDAAGDLYVADSGNDRVSVFAGDGSFLRTLVGSMDDPQDVAFDAGQIFVADKGNDRVDVLSSTGAFVRQIGEGELVDPTGVAVDGSTVYVADSGNNRVARFSVTGAPLGSIELASPFSPRDAIVGGDGDLYVADFGNERVDVFTKGGGFLRSFGEGGSGALSGPVALALDGSGGIYVADQSDERVEHFTEAGSFLGGFPAEPNVAGVAAACGGNVFAVEESASIARVVRFGEPGTPQPPCVESPQPEPIFAPVARLPSNKFHFAGLVKNRSNGFAVLYVRVSAPGRVSLKGRGFRRLSRTARQATTVSIPIKPKVRLRHFLKRHGKGRIRVAVTFTPTGGVPRTHEKVIVLRRKRG
jgi:DNA-binding beta-propeller fold protein YncE